MPPFNYLDDANVWRAVASLETAMFVYATVFAAALAVMAVIGTLSRRPPALVAVVVAATVGVVAATPVHVEWNDGCNDHDARVALIGAAGLRLGHAMDQRLTYDGVQSLVLCTAAGSGAPGRRVSLEATPTSEESDMGEENAADKERAMREHEREARERDPDERSPEGERGGRDGSVVEPAPPGNVQEGTSTGS